MYSSALLEKHLSTKMYPAYHPDPSGRACADVESFSGELCRARESLRREYSVSSDATLDVRVSLAEPFTLLLTVLWSVRVTPSAWHMAHQAAGGRHPDGGFSGFMPHQFSEQAIRHCSRKNAQAGWTSSDSCGVDRGAGAARTQKGVARRPSGIARRMLNSREIRWSLRV